MSPIEAALSALIKGGGRKVDEVEAHDEEPVDGVARPCSWKTETKERFGRCGKGCCPPNSQKKLAIR